MNYCTELESWRSKIIGWLGEEARLVHVSSHSSDVRIYRLGNRIVKVRRLTPASTSNRLNTLEDEFHLLRQLNKRNELVAYLPVAVRYGYEPEWEFIEMSAVEPPQIFDPVVSRSHESISDLLSVACAIWRLNRVGVSHGDLKISNAGRNRVGNITLLDFDQAVFSHPARCFLRDLIGVPCLARAAQFTLLDRFCELRLVSPLVECAQWLRSKLGRKRFGERRAMDNLSSRAAARGDVDLQQLAACWRAAARSGANSPDSEVAYYSADFAGMHFAGERPWVLRWSIISSAVSFRQKRVVELGCNLGLLSIHARLAGAETVVAADWNQEVLDAAGKAAAVFGVNVDFKRVDFDQDVDWESALGRGDLVTALSLTYWLRDKERLWTYLGRFHEVVFEGHEPVDEIERKFRSLGFTFIREIGISERNRKVIHATREHASLLL